MDEMLQRLDRRLSDIQTQQLTLEKANKRQAKLRARLTVLEEETAVFTQTLAKEFRDVARLQKLSLTALFHTMLGSKEAQLDKELQAQLAAQLKH